MAKKLKYDDDSSSSEENETYEIESIEESLEKAKCNWNKLAEKLFRIIDAFFEANSHINEVEFCEYKKAYYKVKWNIIRVLAELKERNHRRQHHHDLKKIRDSDESSEYSDESSESNESKESRDSREWGEKIESKRHFKRVVRYLLKSTEEFYRKCVERRQKELNELKRNIHKIKIELVKLLKKVFKIINFMLFLYGISRN